MDTIRSVSGKRVGRNVNEQLRGSLLYVDPGHILMRFDFQRLHGNAFLRGLLGCFTQAVPSIMSFAVAYSLVAPVVDHIWCFYDSRDTTGSSNASLRSKKVPLVLNNLLKRTNCATYLSPRHSLPSSTSTRPTPLAAAQLAGREPQHSKLP